MEGVVAYTPFWRSVPNWLRLAESSAKAWSRLLAR